MKQWSREVDFIRHPMSSDSRKRKSSCLAYQCQNAVNNKKYSTHEPDLMTTTPKLIRSLLSTQFPVTQQAAFAYIQSVKNISICTSPSQFVPQHGPAAAPSWFYTRVFWTGREGMEAKTMLYEIIVSFVLNLGRVGWDVISTKDFAESAVRNFVFAVQRVVECIWMEPMIQCDQKYSSTMNIGQEDQESDQREQEYFNIFTALVYHIYALVHESLVFICSTMEQSVLSSFSGAKQRFPLLSQVYLLPTFSRPVVGEDGIATLIRRLERELEIYFDATVTSSNRVVSPVAPNRLYGILRETVVEMDANVRCDLGNSLSGQTNERGEEYVFLQILIGRLCPMEERENLPYGNSEENFAGKKFLVLYQPCTNLCVIGTAGRRPPSKLLDLTPRLLAALVGTVCGDIPGRFFHTGGSKEKAVLVTAGLIESMRFQDMNGSYPLSLLQSAMHIQRGLAVGRFRCFAMKNSDSVEDPLMEIERVSTALMVGTHNGCRRSLENSIPFKQNAQSIQVSKSEMSELTSKNSGVLILDHSESHKAGRFLSQQNELGDKGDCPLKTRVSWKWVGVTDAALKCCEELSDEGSSYRSEVTHKKQSFSCGVTFEGHNVFQGLQSLVAMGLAATPLPDFIRDCPTKGSSVIAVCHGKLISIQSNKDRDIAS